MLAAKTAVSAGHPAMTGGCSVNRTISPISAKRMEKIRVGNNAFTVYPVLLLRYPNVLVPEIRYRYRSVTAVIIANSISSWGSVSSKCLLLKIMMPIMDPADASHSSMLIHPGLSVFVIWFLLCR